VRRSLVALLVALTALVTFAPAVTPVRAAAVAPKVVIIVGATHSATSKYRTYANAAYAEAIKYTPNVFKVYSPNATWSKVKSTAKGASIVIYFGHGNGWPSPYTYDPEYKTKDGFGLNASAGNGDNNNKYYGEPYVSTLDLADNAIVMLHHLCYASGNSEPGDGQPSVSTAKKRISNYAAGFLKTKASVVLADGHRGPVDYLRLLFTSNQTIESMWRTAPGSNGHVSAFSSTRTSGATAFMDPEGSSSGFYRSLVLQNRALGTRDVVGGFSVPGRAEAKAGGAPLYAAVPFPTDETGAPQPTAVLPAGTRLKLVATAAGTTGDAVFEVEGLDDPSITGFVAAPSLEPRDSTPPSLISLAGGGGATYTTTAAGEHRLSGGFSESSTWRVRISRGSTVHVEETGTGATFAVDWQPAVEGAGDGAYAYEIRAEDAWKNGPLTATGTLTIDTTPPTGSAEIDGGAATSIVGSVRVGVDATDAVSGLRAVRLSNSDALDADGVLATGMTFTYASTVGWTLAPGRGARTVHVQWQDVAGNWSAVDSDAIDIDPPDTTYRTLTPVRLLDTRTPLPGDVARLTADVPMTFQVAGRGGIPADAIAVSGNLTVVGQTAAGYVSLGPVVGTKPSTSSLNMPVGDVRGNGLVVALDPAGLLEAVYKAAPGARTHLVFDATGYFTADDGGSGYHGLTPARFLDSRLATGPTTGSPLAPGAPLAIEVAGRTVGSVTIPDDAVAITGNLTVTGQTSGGYLTLTPSADTAPTTSTLNFPSGDTRGNAFIAPLGSDGRVHVVYSGTGTVHAILDVTGYFASGEGGLAWVPLAPSRILDSRIDLGKTGPFSSGVPGTVHVRSAGGVEDDAAAFSGNLTVVGQTRSGYVAMTPQPTADPTTSTINFPTGDVRGNGVVATIDEGSGDVSLTYRASSGATVEIVLDVGGFFH
jgi:hypothetical protein